MHRDARRQEVTRRRDLFMVPSLDLVVVTTSDPNAPSRSGTHLDEGYGMMDDIVTAGSTL